ncbi:MAG: type II secretion system F family protein [Thermodesulfovibrionales bacterium]
MPIFQYKGYRGDGTGASGTIEADGVKDAAAKIKESGLFPEEVREYIHREKTFFPGKQNAALLPALTRQLSILLSAGVPLIEALRSLAEENRGFWKQTLIDIRERTAGGASLSRALSEHKSVFNDFYVNMIAAGEASGKLSSVLSRLADFLEQQDAVKQRVRIAMIYPVFMVCVCFIVLSFLFVLVIPKIVKIFEDTKGTLPLITIILINISNVFQKYWWIMTAAAIGCIYGFKRFREKNALRLDRFFLKMPGNIVQNLYLARFTRTFGFLLESGLPMLKALELSSKSVGNTAISKMITEAEGKIAEGSRLSASLEGFSPVLLQLIATGEKSGRLAEVLSMAADSYEEEFSRKVQKALSLLEPVMILFMGLIVGFIVFAVLLPMFQLNQLVR